jgi:hypothetical protein
VAGPDRSDATYRNQKSDATTDHSASGNSGTDSEMEEPPTTKKQNTSQSKQSKAGNSGPARKKDARMREGDDIQRDHGKTHAEFVYIVDIDGMH